MTVDSYEFMLGLKRYIAAKTAAMPASSQAVTLASASSTPYYSVVATANTGLSQSWEGCILQFAEASTPGPTPKLVKSVDSAAKRIVINNRPRSGIPIAGDTATLMAGPLKVATYSMVSFNTKAMDAAFATATPCHVHMRAPADAVSPKVLAPQRAKWVKSSESSIEVWVYLSRSDDLATSSTRLLPAVVEQIIEFIVQYVTTEDVNNNVSFPDASPNATLFEVSTKLGQDPTTKRPVIAAKIEFLVKFN